MAEAAAQEAEKPRRGPKPQPRTKALISMTASDYETLCAWVDEDGTTKAAVVHEMMKYERMRRAALKKEA